MKAWLKEWGLECMTVLLLCGMAYTVGFHWAVCNAIADSELSYRNGVIAQEANSWKIGAEEVR